MKPSFNIGKSIYFVMVFVLLIGIFLVVVKSERFLNYKDVNTLFKQEGDSIPVIKASEELKNSQDIYLIISNSTDKIESRYSELFANTLVQLKKQFRQIDVNDKTADFSAYTGIIIATEDLSKLTQINQLIDYTEQGGSLFFAVRPSPSSTLSAIYQTLGIVELGDFIQTNGLELATPLLSSDGHTSFDSQSIQNSSLSIRLNKEVNMLATSSEGVPLLWEKDLNKGKLVVFNGSMLNDYSNRSLFIKALTMMTDEFIYPIINAKVTAIEGFPFPIPNGLAQALVDSKSLSTRDFYGNQWWLEILRLEAKYDLNYSAGYVVSYDTDFIPFKPQQYSENQEDLASFGKELVKMGGELAIQSYSDRPLSTEKTSRVLTLVKDMKNRINHALPGYPVISMIPPDDPFQLGNYQTIFTNMPEIKTVLANTEAVQLYGDTVILPKTIVGYDLNTKSEWVMQNELFASGYYAQAITPQYFLEKDTSFHESMQEFQRTQEIIQTDVPWLKGLTLTKTHSKAKAYLQTEIFEERTEKGIKFYSSALIESQSFFFKTTKQITYTENCDVKKIAKNLYLIEATQSNFEIGLEEL
ncbi:MAG: DUF2194 domain-containing protein [Bacillus sp. (in: Bacteria)]|nr:DUF2194 domain-containing protein [Bacillus sp. (in: firmicutes)]